MVKLINRIARELRYGQAGGGSQRSLFDAERRSFRSRALVVGSHERSMARDRHRRSFLGISGP